MNQNVPHTSSPTPRLTPLRTGEPPNDGFDDRAAAAALLQIKRSPSSAHSPLLPHDLAPPQQYIPDQQQPGYFPPHHFQHYVYSVPALPSSPSRKRKRSPSPRTFPPPPAPEPHIDVESDDPVRCICGYDVDDGFTIQCERCHVWQHAACQGIKDQDTAPDVYLCERCDPAPRNVDHENARKLQYERLGITVENNVVVKKRNRARRPRQRTSNARLPVEPQSTLQRRASTSPLSTSSPSEQYVPIASNIIHPSVRPFLRSFAHAWRGVTALTDDPSDPLTPLATSDPLPAPLPTEEAEEKTFLDPSPPVHPSRPPSYTLRALRPIARCAYVVPYTCAVTPAAAYLREPASQYAQLGVPKQGVHLIPPPLALCLDARTAGGDARWLRSGCHPNAVLRPVVCGSNLGRRSSSSHSSAEEDVDTETDPFVTFGVFALRDLKASEEIILGWEWDDRHVVHELPRILRGERGMEGVKRAMGQVLAGLCETFRTCACGGDVKGCAIREMERLVGAEHVPPDVAQHRLSHERARYEDEEEDVDLGPLVGARRGLRTEVVGAAGGREGVRIVDEKVNVMKVANAWKASKRKKGKEEVEGEEMLPPKMRKQWIKETVKWLHDGAGVEQESGEELKSPSDAMAGLTLHPREGSPTTAIPSPTSSNMIPPTSPRVLSSLQNEHTVPLSNTFVAPSPSQGLHAPPPPEKHASTPPRLGQDLPLQAEPHGQSQPIPPHRMTPGPQSSSDNNATAVPLPSAPPTSQDHAPRSSLLLVSSAEPPPPHGTQTASQAVPTSQLEASSQLQAQGSAPSPTSPLVSPPEPPPPQKPQPTLTRRTLADWKSRKERERRIREEEQVRAGNQGVVSVEEKKAPEIQQSPVTQVKDDTKGNSVQETKVNGEGSRALDTTQGYPRSRDVLKDAVSIPRDEQHVDHPMDQMPIIFSKPLEINQDPHFSRPPSLMNSSRRPLPSPNVNGVDLRMTDGQAPRDAPVGSQEFHSNYGHRTQYPRDALRSSPPPDIVNRWRTTSPPAPHITSDDPEARGPSSSNPAALPRPLQHYSPMRPRSPPTRPRFFRDVSPSSRPRDSDRERALPRAPRGFRPQFSSNRSSYGGNSQSIPYRPEPEGGGSPSYSGTGRSRPYSSERKNDRGWNMRGRVRGGYGGGYEGRR